MKYYQFFIAAATISVANAIGIHFNLWPISAGQQLSTALVDCMFAAVCYKLNK